MKILLVDDSTLIRGYIAGLLRAPGRAVTAVATVEAALESAATQKPDAILMDFVLGAGHTGLEALSAIFSLTTAPPPHAAILTQGELTPTDARRAQTLGVAVLQKPVRGQEQEFLQRINDWLEAGRA